MQFTGLDITLPTALHLSADGTAENITDMRNLKADVKLSAKTQDLNFVTALVDPKLTKDYRIPNGMTLDGTLKANGTKYATNMTLREGSGLVKLIGDATIPMNAKGDLVVDNITYDANINVSNLNLHHFMPKDSLYNVSATIKAKGYGTDMLNNRNHLTADATIHQLQYGSWDLRDITAQALLKNGRGHVSASGHNELFDGLIDIDALLSSKEIEAITESLCCYSIN